MRVLAKDHAVRPQETNTLLHETHHKVPVAPRYQGLVCVDP